MNRVPKAIPTEHLRSEALLAGHLALFLGGGGSGDISISVRRPEG